MCNLCLTEDLETCIVCKNINNFEINNLGKKICLKNEKKSNEIKISTEIENDSSLNFENTNTFENEEKYSKEYEEDSKNESDKEEETEKEINIKTEYELENEKESENENTSKKDNLNNKDKECSTNEIILNHCNDGIINEEQIIEIYKNIKKEFLKDNYTQEITVLTKNAIFQITNSEEQKIITKSNSSFIDLGGCESKLKQKYNISENEPLVIFK